MRDCQSGPPARTIDHVLVETQRNELLRGAERRPARRGGSACRRCRNRPFQRTRLSIPVRYRILGDLSCDLIVGGCVQLGQIAAQRRVCSLAFAFLIKMTASFVLSDARVRSNLWRGVRRLPLAQKKPPRIDLPEPVAFTTGRQLRTRWPADPLGVCPLLLGRACGSADRRSERERARRRSSLRPSNRLALPAL